MNSVAAQLPLPGPLHRPDLAPQPVTGTQPTGAPGTRPTAPAAPPPAAPPAPSDRAPSTRPNPPFAVGGQSPGYGLPQGAEAAAMPGPAPDAFPALRFADPLPNLPELDLPAKAAAYREALTFLR